MFMILLIILILMMFGSAPAWPYSSGWGYGPSGLLFIVVLVLVVMMFSGRIPR